jgi:hypothetical protein
VRLAPALFQHGGYEVGADDPPAKPWAPSQSGPEVQGPGAQVEVNSFRLTFPPQPRDAVPPPSLIEVKADDAIEAVVGGGYGSKDGPDIIPLFRTA